MIKGKKKYTSILLLVLLIFSSVLLLNDSLLNRSRIKRYKMSVIVSGKNSDRWMVMKDGIDLASSEMNVEIRFITLSEENSVIEQTELIEREINEGADAILVSPVNYELMKIPIENAFKKVPIVLTQSNIESEEPIPYISSDNYELGVCLAEEMMQMGNTRVRVAIIKSNLSCSSVKERYEGFMDTVNETKNTYTFWEVSADELDAYKKVKNIIQEDLADVVVGFDTFTLEEIGKAKKDLASEQKEELPVEIYGAGSTNKIISYLEEKVISGTAVQNEFNIGYLGVKTAFNMIRDEDINIDNINFTVVNSRNMYSNENQRLLFPFVR